MPSSLRWRPWILAFALLTWLIPTRVTADFSRFPVLEPIGDHLQKLVAKYDFKRFEPRISDPVDSPEGKRYPAQFDFIFVGSEQAMAFLKDMEEFRHDNLSFRVKALVISQSPEVRPSDRRSLLYATVVAALTEGPAAPELPHYDPGPLATIFGQTTFDAGIARQAPVEGIDLWLTNLRRGQPENGEILTSLTGYVFQLSRLWELARTLAASGQGVEVALHTIKSTNMSGIPVFRFELAVRENRKTPLPIHAWEIFERIDAAVSAAKGRIASLRVAPAIQIKEKFGLPVELAVENLVTDEWKQLKETLAGLKSQNVAVIGTSDQGMTDQGFTLRLKVAIEP